MDIRTQNLQKKIHSIREFIYAKIYSFENIRFKQGEITGAEQPQFDDSNWEEFRVGQFWGGKDVTCWFRIPFQVQEKIQDGKSTKLVHIVLDKEMEPNRLMTEHESKKLLGY